MRYVLAIAFVIALAAYASELRVKTAQGAGIQTALLSPGGPLATAQTVARTGLAGDGESVCPGQDGVSVPVRLKDVQNLPREGVSGQPLHSAAELFRYTHLER